MEKTLTTAIDPNTVESVYSGKDGACCCGCKGTHSEDRRNINRITKLINKDLSATEDLDSCASVVVGTRLYIAYFRDGAR